MSEPEQVPNVAVHIPVRVRDDPTAIKTTIIKDLDELLRKLNDKEILNTLTYEPKLKKKPIALLTTLNTKYNYTDYKINNDIYAYQGQSGKHNSF